MPGYGHSQNSTLRTWTYYRDCKVLPCLCSISVQEVKPRISVCVSDTCQAKDRVILPLIWSRLGGMCLLPQSLSQDLDICSKDSHSGRSTYWITGVRFIYSFCHSKDIYWVPKWQALFQVLGIQKWSWLQGLPLQCCLGSNTDYTS